MYVSKVTRGLWADVGRAFHEHESMLEANAKYSYTPVQSSPVAIANSGGTIFSAPRRGVHHAAFHNGPRVALLGEGAYSAVYKAGGD